MSSNQQTGTSDRYLTPRSGDAWAAEAATVGRRGTQRIVAVEEVNPHREVAEALQLDAAARVVLRRRVMLLDDRPVELTDSYYPASIARDTALARPTKIPGGAVTLLADLGYTANDPWDDITARHPTPKEQHELNISDHEPVIVLTRLSATDAGTPFEYSVMVMVAKGRHLRYRAAS